MYVSVLIQASSSVSTNTLASLIKYFDGMCLATGYTRIVRHDIVEISIGYTFDSHRHLIIGLPELVHINRGHLYYVPIPEFLYLPGGEIIWNAYYEL